jgi:hypothetical protein
MVAYQNAAAKFFGVEAAGYKDDDEYEVAHWFKVCVAFLTDVLAKSPHSFTCIRIL